MNIEPKVNAWYCGGVALLTTYKKIGETPLEALERLRKEKNLPETEKMTYAGRLDPAAEGLLLVLTGHDVHQKDAFLNLDKTYEFQVLFGVSTDSLDVLGLVQDVQLNEKDQALTFLSKTNEFVGSFEWEYPKFSSKTIEGKPMFEYAREGVEIENPYRQMNIFSLELIGRKYEQLKNLKSHIVSVVYSVSGDFRQKEILKKWEEVFQACGDTHVSIVSFRARVSSGTYIRVLAQKMGESVGLPALAFSIKRTSVGTIEV